MDISSGERIIIILTRLVLCFPFVVVGAIGFYYFLDHSNWNASFWSILLDIICIFVIRMNTYYIQKRMLPVYDTTTMFFLKVISIIYLAASGVATTAYITLGSSHHQDFQVDGDGYYPAALIAFFTFIWSFVWFWDVRKFDNLLVVAAPSIQIQRTAQTYQSVIA